MEEKQYTTGKTVGIRHATKADTYFIEEKLRQYGLDAEDLRPDEFVMATEDGDIIGFGRLKKTGEMYAIGSVTVVEERRGRGIGSLIIKHLIDYSPTKTVIVYVNKDLVEYFRKLGFIEMKEGSKELFDALDAAFKIKGSPDTIIMVHEKPYA